MQNDPFKSPETPDTPNTTPTPPAEQPVDISSELSSSGTTTTSPLDPSVTPPPAPLPPADSSNNPFPEKPKSKASLIIIAIVGVLVLAAAGFFGYQYYMSTLDNKNNQDNTAEQTPHDHNMPEQPSATELDTFMTSLKQMLDSEVGLTVATADEDKTKTAYPPFYKPVGADYFVYPAEYSALFITSEDNAAALKTLESHLVGMNLEKDETSESIYSSDSLLCNVLETGISGAMYISVTCADNASYAAVANETKPFYEAFKTSADYKAESSYVLNLPVITDENGQDSETGNTATMEISDMTSGTFTVEFIKVNGAWTVKSASEEDSQA